MAQEALRNAVRHAAPGDVRVGLVSTDGLSAVLEVTDDGEGFDVEAAERSRDGMGMFVMRERMGLIDGRLEVVSRPGAGTTIRAWAPLAHGDHREPAEGASGRRRSASCWPTTTGWCASGCARC